MNQNQSQENLIFSQIGEDEVLARAVMKYCASLLNKGEVKRILESLTAEDILETDFYDNTKYRYNSELKVSSDIKTQVEEVLLTLRELETEGEVLSHDATSTVAFRLLSMKVQIFTIKFHHLNEVSGQITIQSTEDADRLFLGMELGSFDCIKTTLECPELLTALCGENSAAAWLIISYLVYNVYPVA